MQDNNESKSTYRDVNTCIWLFYVLIGLFFFKLDSHLYCFML